jgi:hypothetical protein
MSGTRGFVGRAVGTRGGLGRLAAMAVGLVVVLALGLAEAAWAGSYEVAQCGWGVGAELDGTGILESRGRGVISDSCSRAPVDPEAGLRLEAEPLWAAGGGLIARWEAPPGTGITGLRGVWAGSMAPGFRRELGFADAGGFHPSVSTGEPGYPGPVGATPSTPAAEAAGFRLVCLLADVAGCRTVPPAWTLVREVTLAVSDPLPPVVRVGGPLLAPGWHRGRVGLEMVGEDPGSGVQRLTATVGGAPVAEVPQPCSTALVEGAVRATAMRPCVRAAISTAEVDTAGLPDGADTLRGCAVDFTGSVGCAPDARVEVDNSPPSVAFARAADGKVAATVGDPYSGPASGSIAVRRADAGDWTPLPTEFHLDGAGAATLVAALPRLEDGAYVFRAEAADALGNAGAATMEVAGSAAAIREAVAAGGSGSGSGSGSAGSGSGAPAPGASRAPRSSGDRPRPRPRHGHPTRLLVGFAAGRGATGRAGAATLTLPFGRRALVRGRLVAGAAATVNGRAVSVVSRPAGGAGPRVVRTVRTDRGGRFSLRLPPGTSRGVVVSFRGGAGLAPAKGRPLTLRVRAAVTLAAAPPSLRTGEEVHFVGTVRRGPARIPGRGKLVAIQYLDRAAGRWRPALVIRTGADGHFHADYRFRYITGAARIRFRATALPEARWPYAPGSSEPVTVAVHGR